MSQYKSAIRAQQPHELVENSKYSSQARQLKEFFPAWSIDDLLSLLADVGGDTEVAATRISDGLVEQWGSVSRKKDKKALASAQASKESFSIRGDLRGARGGRGGRGGSGRGGGAVRGRGTPRGGAVNGRSPRVGSPNPTQTHINNISETKDTRDAIDEYSAESTSLQNGWTNVSSSHSDTPVISTTSSWGQDATWGGESSVNGSSASVNIPSAKAASKPANSKLSWAQVARPQEKSTPPTPAQMPAATVTTTLVLTSPSVPPTSVSESETETQSQKWEEPTTAQPPIWDDEPQTKLSIPSIGDRAFPSEEEAKVKQPELLLSPKQQPLEVEIAQKPPSPEPAPEQLSTSKSEPAPQPSLATPVLSQAAAATPSPKLSSRSAVTHRSSARYKNIDQPVVMPSSFGAGIEKIGMQFGSLNIGGDSLLDSNPSESDAPNVASSPPSPPSPPAPEQQESLPPPSTAPASTSLSSAAFSQQQPQPQPTPIQPSAALHSIPTSVSQPLQTQTPSSVHTTAATSPIQQYAQHQQAQHQTQQHQAQQHQVQQHSLASVHQQPHHQLQHVQHPQHTPQSHNQYAQHGLPTHIDPSQQTQSPQQQNGATHSNYFGRAEAAATAPYLHTPTPPVGQAQDYGSFGQLAAQAQHQQGSHLGGFGSQDYGYSESQRGFYEAYQPSGFGGRNVLSHEDIKGLPGTQQPPASAGLPPSGAQTSQPHVSLQGAGQPQSGGTQAPQQGYPVPYPYYSYPQSQQFYGYGPNYAAVPQPFKYPAMYQPPPGPGSAPSPVTKQPGTGSVGVNVQPQSNPYSQGLYPQAGYDDYPQHQHHPQHSQQHSHSLGLGQTVSGAEYSKQLYGSAGQSGMQGFMGLSGQGASAGGPTSGSVPRGAASPEAPYKPYAPKDIGGVAAGRGTGPQQGQVQTQPQSQSQGPQGQGFYGGARFGGGGGSVGGPQQSAHHPQGGPQGHLGYPQSGNDGNFYQYRAQQQGYWQ